MNIKSCKRGNIAERDKYGHCLCVDCVAHRVEYRKSRSAETLKYQKEWRDANKDKVKQYTKKWVDNNIEKRKEIVKSWRSRNPEAVKKYNSKAGKKWTANNRGRRNDIPLRRELAKKSRTPPWADLSKIRWFYEEAERLTKETGVPHEVDHIIPLQGKNICGLHVHNNLQILTREENRSKGNKFII